MRALAILLLAFFLPPAQAADAPPMTVFGATLEKLKAGTLSKEEAETTLAWAKKKERDGEIPYWHLQSLLQHHLGQHEAALRSYFIGQVVARVDTYRCNDESASAAIQVVRDMVYQPLLAGEARAYFDAHASAKAKALFTEGFRVEDGVKERRPALWICNHGLGSPKGITSEKDWPAQRTAVVKELKAAFLSQFR